MANFILVEHELTELGGHNFQYAMDILGAAEESGYQPVLAVNKEFKPPDAWPASWWLIQAFQASSTMRHCAGVTGGSRHPICIDGHWLDAEETPFLERWLDCWNRQDRIWRINDFVEGCCGVFDALGIHREDRVFFSTMSEFDLLGLAKFLNSRPETGELDWHLQFHFDIYHGREPDYDHQVRQTNLLTRQINEALQIVKDCSIRWYATTEKVARQYNRLGHAEFQPLPYPTNKRFLERRNDALVNSSRRPLKVALAGAMRREKGRRELAQLIDALAPDFLDTGRVQIWLQTNPTNVRRLITSRWRQDLDVHAAVPVETSDPIVAVQHPLDPSDYVDLICQSDIGLFLYDSLRYHARCSGVLVEMLTVGIPVVVPAACWLADQIQRPAFAYLSNLVDSEFALSRIALGASAVTGSASGPVRFEGPNAPLRREAIDRPKAASDLVISLDYAADNPPGHYVRITVKQWGEDQQCVAQPWSSIVGPTRDDIMATLIPLEEDTRNITIELANAFSETQLSASVAQLTFLEAPPTMAHHARSVVGVIATDHAQIPQLLHEVVEQYAHYRQSAIDFSSIWSYEHAPQRTVELLNANCQPNLKRQRNVA